MIGFLTGTSARKARQAASLEPLPNSAPYVGWGLALLLLAIIPGAAGLASEGALVVAGLMVVAGTIALAIGVAGLTEKADLAFAYRQEKHAAWRSAQNQSSPEK